MSKKTLIIVGLIFLLLAIALFIGAIVISRESADSDPNGATGSFGKSLGDFLPFGKSSDNTAQDGLRDNNGRSGTQAGTPAGNDKNSETTSRSVLRQLTTEPIAGAIAVRNREGKVAVRFVDRALGNIFEVNPETLSSVRITNTTIPAVHEAWWGTQDSVILRYLDELGVIKTYSAKIHAASTTPTFTGETPSATLVGTFLDDDITHVAVSPDGTKLFSFKKIGARGAGVVSGIDGKNNQSMLDSSFSQWFPQWTSAQTIALSAKASDGVYGSLYFLDTKTKSLKQVITKIPGMTTLTSRDATKVLYSESGSVRGVMLKTSLWNAKTRTASDFTVTTLPEKCVWGLKNTEVLYCAAPVFVPQGIIPDQWYQGIISLSDNVWKIDTKNDTVHFLASPERETRATIDVINPFLSDDESYLFFTNKNDLTLWALSLEEKTD